MYLRDNPVLAHELLVNLRMRRAFVLWFVYVLALCAVVYLPWPDGGQVETSAADASKQLPDEESSSGLTATERIGAAAKAQQLFKIFFLGQFALVALMAPSNAAGSITGEKERKTYELLIASPLEPGAVLVGKLLSSLCYLTLLIMSSAPLMVLCWLLGGIALNEIVMAYGVLFLSAGTFGLVSLGTSSFFARTSSSLVVSYLIILPLALTCLTIWLSAEEEFRVFAGIVLLPPICMATWAAIVSIVNRRLLYPPDVGSEGKEVIDEEADQANTVGLVIRRDMFPDRLFAPAKRTDLMEDGTNPVLEKELRSEVFSQGTLMLRVVIQVSMVLSIGIMAVFMFWKPDLIGYYIAYVVVFNMLVGPVFSAGSITQERERETLELLLTTLLKPSQIIFAKLISSLRVSTVLTLLLTEQIILAYVMVDELHPNIISMFTFFAIILATCLLTTTIGLFCSVICRKTSAAMILTYVVMLVLFLGPIAIVQFLQPFTNLSEYQISQLTITSPFAAIFQVPLHFKDVSAPGRLAANAAASGTLPVHWIYLAFAVVLSIVLLFLMDVLFRLRWRAASQGAAA